MRVRPLDRLRHPPTKHRWTDQSGSRRLDLGSVLQDSAAWRDRTWKVVARFLPRSWDANSLAAVDTLMLGFDRYGTGTSNAARDRTLPPVSATHDCAFQADPTSPGSMETPFADLQYTLHAADRQR
jgi:hypothetical protein